MLMYPCTKQTIISMNPSEVDIFGYHHPCQDGSMSAAVFALRNLCETEGVKKEEKVEESEDGLKKETKDDKRKITYHPVTHGVPLSEEIITSFAGKNAMFCDIVPREADLVKILATAKKVYILDHHVSQLKVLQKYFMPEMYVYSEVHSGCGLAWKFCFPGTAMPYILQVIEAHDLGRITEESKRLSYYVNALTVANPDPRTLIPLIQNPLDIEELTKTVDVIFNKGVATLKAQLLETQRISTLSVGKTLVKTDGKSETKTNSEEKAKVKTGTDEVKTFSIVYAHCADFTLIADAKVLFTQLHPECDIFAFWRYDERLDMTTFSLRTPKPTSLVDLSVIASYFGGGGHAAASGVQAKGRGIYQGHVGIPPVF